MRVSRRALMLSAGTGALGAALPFRRTFADTEIKEYRLTAGPAVVNLTGSGHLDTAVWTYDGTVPGPELRIRQGERVRLVVSNKLDEAREVVERLRVLTPVVVPLYVPFRNSEHRELLLSGLRLAAGETA
jgi:FtsP/CotA-like multicopper oxidase with cupredoxin domain